MSLKQLQLLQEIKETLQNNDNTNHFNGAVKVNKNLVENTLRKMRYLDGFEVTDDPESHDLHDEIMSFWKYSDPSKNRAEIQALCDVSDSFYISAEQAVFLSRMSRLCKRVCELPEYKCLLDIEESKNSEIDIAKHEWSDESTYFDFELHKDKGVAIIDGEVNRNDIIAIARFLKVKPEDLL